MLHHELITIGKLRTAFDLSESEVDGLLVALASPLHQEDTPTEVIFPHTLWRHVWERYWKTDAVMFAKRYDVPVPDFPPSHFEHDRFDNEFYAFLGRILPLVRQHVFEQGFAALLSETYDPTPQHISDNMELFWALFPSDKDFADKPCPTAKMKAKETAFHSRNLSKYLKEIFVDALTVKKAAAVQHLAACGYPYRQEVKGLSRAFFEGIAQEYFTPSPTPVEAVPQDDSNALNPDGVASALRVPRHLWEGKSPTTARDAMRREGYDDAVVAHVLFVWCRINNKTRVGKLLAKTEMEDSACRKFCQRLLNKAENINIMPS